MKENELMIGDFLRFKQDYPFKHLRSKTVMVSGIRGRVDVKTIDDGNYYESEHPDWLEPIPLTPEILEKNGFVEIKDYEPYVYYLLKAGRFSISLEHCFDSFDNEDYWSCSISNRKSDATLSVHAIHELQHALRLCLIEKEIVL